MKRLSFLLLLSLLFIAFVSCEKEENRIYLERSETPVLSSTTTSPLLRPDDSLKVAIKLSWTNPEFQFTTGINSQDVNYLLEIDTAGANFSSPDKVSIGVNKELTRSFEVRELNDFILNTLKMKHSEEHSLEVRVKATIGTSTASLFTNSISFKATPYPIPPKVRLPSLGELYIVGDATQGGWTNPVPVPSQQFTRISETIYEIVVNLKGGGAYLLLPVNGSWDYKYNVASKNAAGISEGGDFGYSLPDDIPGPAAAGDYKITVDFQRGKFTVVKQ